MRKNVGAVGWGLSDTVMTQDRDQAGCGWGIMRCWGIGEREECELRML